jgi:hypothetical protein
MARSRASRAARDDSGLTSGQRGAATRARNRLLANAASNPPASRAASTANSGISVEGPAPPLQTTIRLQAEAQALRDEEYHQARMDLLAAQQAAINPSAAPRIEDHAYGTPYSAEADPGERLLLSIPPAHRDIINTFALGRNIVEICKISRASFQPQDLFKLAPASFFAPDEKKAAAPEVSQLLLHYPTISKWSVCFSYYMSFVLAFVGAQYPHLVFALANFHAQVFTLAEKYEWTTAVLPLAIRFHTQRTSTGFTDTSAWEIDAALVLEHCVGKEIPPPRAQTSKARPANDDNNSSAICRKFNSDAGCNGPPICNRRHELYKRPRAGSESDEKPWKRGREKKKHAA